MALKAIKNWPTYAGFGTELDPLFKSSLKNGPLIVSSLRVLDSFKSYTYWDKDKEVIWWLRRMPQKEWAEELRARERFSRQIRHFPVIVELFQYGQHGHGPFISAHMDPFETRIHGQGVGGGGGLEIEIGPYLGTVPTTIDLFRAKNPEIIDFFEEVAI